MVYVDFKKLELPQALTQSNPGLVKKLKRYLLKKEIDIRSYCKANPPHVLRKESYELISKHHVYLLLQDAEEKGFQAIEVSEKDCEEIMKIDRVNTALLEAALFSDKTHTGAAITHQGRRTAKQVCPLCGGPLARQKNNAPQNVAGQKMFEVHCHYNEQNYPHIACSFSVLLEIPEFNDFKKNKYPTSLWIEDLKTKCPKCKEADLYKRTTLSGKVFHRCLNTLTGNNERCDFNSQII